MYKEKKNSGKHHPDGLVISSGRCLHELAGGELLLALAGGDLTSCSAASCLPSRRAPPPHAHASTRSTAAACLPRARRWPLLLGVLARRRRPTLPRASSSLAATLPRARRQLPPLMRVLARWPTLPRSSAAAVPAACSPAAAVPTGRARAAAASRGELARRLCAALATEFRGGLRKE